MKIKTTITIILIGILVGLVAGIVLMLTGNRAGHFILIICACLLGVMIIIHDVYSLR